MDKETNNNIKPKVIRVTEENYNYVEDQKEKTNRTYSGQANHIIYVYRILKDQKPEVYAEICTMLERQKE